MTQEISAPRLFPTSPTIRAESEQVDCCGQHLLIQKTEKRSVITLSIGKIHIQETVKQCKICKKTYVPEQPSQLAPQYCNFGFDIIVHVGKTVFQSHRTENEVATELRQQNVLISVREVSYLAKKFICYLALAHQEKIPEIRELIENNGGSCLHFDGTNDGGGPHLIVAVDEQEKLVLGSIKAPSESTESVSVLLEQVKCDYGNPVALVHDMSKANLSAAQNVFPCVADYVCHFHFLRDIGKDLFGYEEAQIRSILQGNGIKGHLRTLATKLKGFINGDQLQWRLGKKTQGPTPKSFCRMAETDIVYLLIEWILDFTEELSGYGFPFDREKLVFIQRMQKVRNLIHALPSSLGYLQTLQRELDDVLKDTMLIKHAAEMEKKAEHFDQLRKILRIAEPEGLDGLNDDALNCDMTVMKAEIKKFINSQEIQRKCKADLDYSKMVKQIKKYWNKLFTKPITVTTKAGQTMTIQPQRTNNLMERFFREANRESRRRTGGKTLGYVLTTMLADTPLIKNLENKKYEKIILGCCDSLAERFAEIEAKEVREKLKRAMQREDKLHPAVKRLIKIPKLPDYLIGIQPRPQLNQAACC